MNNHSQEKRLPELSPPIAVKYVTSPAQLLDDTRPLETLPALPPVGSRIIIIREGMSHRVLDQLFVSNQSYVGILMDGGVPFEPLKK